MEFELRLQQYIEMIRTGDKTKIIEGMQHAKKFLSPHLETQSTEIHRAAGLLAFQPGTVADRYKVRENLYASQIARVTPTDRYIGHVL